MTEQEIAEGSGHAACTPAIPEQIAQAGRLHRLATHSALQSHEHMIRLAERRSFMPQIAVHGIEGVVVNGDHPFLVTFAKNTQSTLVLTRP